MAGNRGTLLIVEDSPETAELLAAVVEEEGFSALVCASAQTAHEAFSAHRPVAVFMDWVLPDRPGTELCRQLRSEDPLVPILFVSGRDDEASISRGLDSGADDFLVKPVRRAELVARLEAHVRKAQAAGVGEVEPGPTMDRTIRLGAVEIDPAARTVLTGGREVSLGPLEFRLLEYFARNAGIAVSREQILNEVYGYDADISTERVDLLVRRLRSKLGEGLDRGNQLVAVAGYGYRLERRAGERAAGG
ncbi:MAG TPA: response regulator transcription factor [Candidatus Nitrosotalea sp.]|nr:response regulator transcription factor [Candidatus Nitrosotalea sp.]